ncbi:HD domain-containing protein [Virgibacillus sp. LDC-1]|uniref:HD domain-containing protein n=1 Tax=Virgibacillus sp. LDC-1 TaxID=3039856 RepID=UPI0032E7F8AA
MMNEQDQLIAIKQYVKHLFSKDASGHDFYHLQRVATLACTIATTEKANSVICEMAAWLHDVGDHKLFKKPQAAIQEMNHFLVSLNLSSDEIDQINHTLAHISFSSGKTPATLEGKIVQDADRLDAIGAIGIARTFAYGGAKGQPMYDPTGKENNSIQHFHDKLFHLKSHMHTATAKTLAEERHHFMETFMEQFLHEWE